MIHRSILALRFGCRTLSDPNSQKKNGIEFVESLFLRNPIASSKMVTDVVEDPVWSLNLRHETWCNPWDKSIASQASFPDLFRQCLIKHASIYYMINSVIEEKIFARHPLSGCWTNLEIILITAVLSAMTKTADLLLYNSVADHATHEQ